MWQQNRDEFVARKQKLAAFVVFPLASHSIECASDGRVNTNSQRSESTQTGRDEPKNDDSSSVRHASGHKSINRTNLAGA